MAREANQDIRVFCKPGRRTVRLSFRQRRPIRVGRASCNSDYLQLAWNCDVRRVGRYEDSICEDCYSVSLTHCGHNFRSSMDAYN